jgi:hypothetical protein
MSVIDFFHIVFNILRVSLSVKRDRKQIKGAYLQDAGLQHTKELELCVEYGG